MRHEASLRTTQKSRGSKLRGQRATRSRWFAGRCAEQQLQVARPS